MRGTARRPGLGFAFRYLMSCTGGSSTNGTLSLATSAYNAVNGETYSTETAKDSMYAQHTAFVYSWLYNILPSVASNARSTLANQLNNYIGTTTTNLLGQFQGGDAAIATPSGTFLFGQICKMTRVTCALCATVSVVLAWPREGLSQNADRRAPV